MRRFLIFMFFVLCCTLQVEARKLALLVGVDKYEDVPPLKCCVNDVNALKKALIKVGFEENDIQILVTDGNSPWPTKRRIERQLEEIFAKAGPSDLIFLSFSGHGAQEGKEVYFCPPDVETDNLVGTCVSITKIMNDLAECKAKFKWVVVDACRNTPYQSAKGIGSKGLQAVPTPPSGIALFQSCAVGEESWEDCASGNGYFTKNLSVALSGEADTDHDGQLTLMEVCKWTTSKTKEQVMNAEKKSQCPYFSGSVSDFPLTENLNVPKAKAIAAEAEKAMGDGNYELAIEKFDAALALCPQFSEWTARKRDAKCILENKKTLFNPMKITIPDDFQTIEEAYANVEDGGTILIKPGKYKLSKTLEVNRKVTFQGVADGPENVVIDCAAFDVFRINGGNPSFQNLTVISTSAKSKEEIPCVFVITGSSPELFRCIITSHKGVGLVVRGKGTNPKVEKCIVKKCGFIGVIVEKEGGGEFSECEICESAGPGIGIAESGNPTFSECKIYDGVDGISIIQGGLGTFYNCEIYGNAGAGIGVQESGNPTVIRCKIHDGIWDGIDVRKGGLGTFKYCEICRNAMMGISVTESGNPTVIECKIHDGKYGVYVSNGGKGTFNNNVLKENYFRGDFSNWVIKSDAGEVKGIGNTPEIPIR